MAPANVAMPSIIGSTGSLNPPVAMITTSARQLREVDCTVHCCRSSFHAALRTVSPNMKCRSMSYRVAHCRRYAHISSCGEKVRLQSGFGANEYEYSTDCTSHAQPG